MTELIGQGCRGQWVGPGTRYGAPRAAHLPQVPICCYPQTERALEGGIRIGLQDTKRLAKQKNGTELGPTQWQPQTQSDLLSLGYANMIPIPDGLPCEAIPSNKV